MKRVVEFSIRQKVFFNVVFVILVVAGAFSMFSIPLENMPVVDMGRVFIHTPYYGASAEDVEQLVTDKIEEALEGMENIEYLKSESYRNFSSIDVKFIDDTDYESLFDDLRFRVLNIREDLPPEAEEPRFLYIDTNLWLPVIIVHVSGPVPRRALERYAQALRTLLLEIPDVRNARIVGKYDTEFHVSLDPVKLRTFGVTFNQAAEAVRKAGVKIPTGRFRTKEREYKLDAGKRLHTQAEVGNIIVRRDGDGNFVRIRDLVTTVRLSHRDPSMIASVNGQPAVRLFVSKEDTGNAVEVSAAVQAVAKAFEARHRQEGLRVIFTNDSTIEINESLDTLGGNLLLGMSLVLIVLWVTLGFRNALLTAIGIPFSFLCSVILMRLAGVSFNSISLFAFVLVTGILVDDAVIIVENIYRHLQMGKALHTAVVDGAAEVMLPVIASALTTVLAFVPMLIMTGFTGEFFSYIPKTVTYALSASLFESLLILPIHALDWGPGKAKIKGVPEASGQGVDAFSHLKHGVFSFFWKAYRLALGKILDRKILTFSLMTLLLVLSVGVLALSATGRVPLIQVEFFPGSVFRYHVTAALPVGTPIEKTDAVIREISRYIVSQGPGQAQSASGSAGYFEDEDYARHHGSHFGQIVVTLPEAKVRRFPENPANDPHRHVDYMRQNLAEFVKARYLSKGQPVRLRVFKENDGPPTGKAVNIRISGDTLQEAIAASDVLLGFMRRHPDLKDLVDLGDNRPDFQKTYRFVCRQEAASEYGISPAAVTRMTAGALEGQKVGLFRTTDEEVDLVVRLARVTDPGNRRGAGLAEPLDLLDVPMIENSRAPLLLGDLADGRLSREPDVKLRHNGKPTVTLTADIRAGSRLSPARTRFLVQEFVKSNPIPFQGIAVAFGGEFESTFKSYLSLSLAFVIALLAIYMVLASQFKEYIQPIIIIFSVPMALIGVVLGLLFTRTPFTVGSFMAIVGLAGLSVNDSLLLIDFMNVRRREGKPLRQAVMEACGARMRPVLITTITTTLGLLPMAVGIPTKSITWAPMATAFISGLISATTFTLLVTPANYEAYVQVKGWVQRRLSSKAEKKRRDPG